MSKQQISKLADAMIKLHDATTATHDAQIWELVQEFDGQLRERLSELKRRARG